MPRSSFNFTYRETVKLVIQLVCCTRVQHTEFCVLDSVVCGNSWIALLSDCTLATQRRSQSIPFEHQILIGLE